MASNEEKLKHAMQLALNMAHVYTFVGDDFFPTAKKALEDYLRTALAEQPSTIAKESAQVAGSEREAYLKWFESNKHHNNTWMAWQEATRQARAQAVPEGWKLVPVEPTPVMIQAALDCQDYDPEDGSDSEMFCLYKAMIAASPSKDK